MNIENFINDMSLVPATHSNQLTIVTSDVYLTLVDLILKKTSNGPTIILLLQQLLSNG